MQQLFHAGILLSFTLWLTGCSDRAGPGPNPETDTSASQPSRPAPPPPVPPQPSPPVGAAGSVSTGQTVAQPQPSSTMPGVSRPQPSSAGQQPIRLATGVALPQTGPEGILMSFSIDYEFTEGEPSSSGYVWVIERAHGSSARQPVKLTKQGNLPILINGWRPEDGPFQTHIEDPRGNLLSASIELR